MHILLESKLEFLIYEVKSLARDAADRWNMMTLVMEKKFPVYADLFDFLWNLHSFAKGFL